MLPTDDKARKALPIFTYDTEYFPDAHIEEVRIAVAGNEQHNPGEPLHWAREKSKDQMNTAYRHMLDHKSGTTKDVDGCYHLAKAIWRLKAELQLTIERDREVERNSAALAAEPVTQATSMASSAIEDAANNVKVKCPDCGKAFKLGDGSLCGKAFKLGDGSLCDATYAMDAGRRNAARSSRSDAG